MQDLFFEYLNLEQDITENNIMIGTYPVLADRLENAYLEWLKDVAD